MQALVFINSDPTDATRAAVVAGVGMVWYVIAKAAAAYNPKWGVLLLIAAQPEYTETENGEEKTAANFLTAVQRTIVPLLAGFVITHFVRLGINIDTATATLVLQGGITSGYYGLLRWIEEYAKRRNQPEAMSATVAGVFLGKPADLSY